MCFIGPLKLYVILADGVYDQVVETPEQVKTETYDLKVMGFKCRTIPVHSWERAYELEVRYK